MSILIISAHFKEDCFIGDKVSVCSLRPTSLPRYPRRLPAAPEDSNAGRGELALNQKYFAQLRQRVKDWRFWSNDVSQILRNHHRLSNKAIIRKAPAQNAECIGLKKYISHRASKYLSQPGFFVAFVTLRELLSNWDTAQNTGASFYSYIKWIMPYRSSVWGNSLLFVS